MTKGATRGAFAKPRQLGDDGSDEEDRLMERELHRAGQPNAADVAVRGDAFEAQWMAERLPKPTKQSLQEAQELYDLL